MIKELIKIDLLASIDQKFHKYFSIIDDNSEDLFLNTPCLDAFRQDYLFRVKNSEYLFAILAEDREDINRLIVDYCIDRSHKNVSYVSTKAVYAENRTYLLFLCHNK